MPDDQSSSFDAAAHAAVQRSVFASLPAHVGDELLRDGRRWDVPARFVLYQSGDVARSCGIVVSGLLRQYIVSPNGRELTLRYARAGTLAGAVIAVSGPTESWAQAVVDTSLLMLDIETVRTTARSNPDVGWALAEEIARTHRELLRALNDTAFGTLRARVAHHLLEVALADPTDEGDAVLHARVTQQALADAVGSVREVVARLLGELRRDGLVETGQGGVVLLDPVRLSEEAESERV
jgi:CRP/FNR family transcriptional regulator, cyclic AMP receptor protein